MQREKSRQRTQRTFAHLSIIAALIGALFLSTSLTGCSAPEEKTQPLILTTFYPLTFITERLAGDFTNVDTLVPAGAEPHDYEPTAQDIIKLGRTDMYIALGLGLAHFEEELTSALPKGTPVVIASKGLALLPSEHTEEEHDQAAQDSDHDHSEDRHDSPYDPHVWLSPRAMAEMTDTIAQELAQRYPLHEIEILNRAQQLKDELGALDTEYREGLSSCSKRTILTSHRAFGYLANDYGFEQKSIGGISPESEPNPGDVAALIDTARNLGITILFTEPGTSMRAAQTIADEIGARVLTLNPIETAHSGDSYITLMRDNLKKLHIAMECTS